MRLVLGAGDQSSWDLILRRVGVSLAAASGLSGAQLLGAGSLSPIDSRLAIRGAEGVVKYPRSLA